MSDCESGIPAAALQIVRLEYDKALTKHPNFPDDYIVSCAGAISIIAEELGEFAKEINDDCLPGWRDRAITEVAHVAVTAIRTMEMLKGKMP